MRVPVPLDRLGTIADIRLAATQASDHNSKHLLVVNICINTHVLLYSYIYLCMCMYIYIYIHKHTPKSLTAHIHVCTRLCWDEHTCLDAACIRTYALYIYI